MNTFITFYNPNNVRNDLFKNFIKNTRFYKFPYAFSDLDKIYKYENIASKDYYNQIIYIKNEKESVIFVPVDAILQDWNFANTIRELNQGWELDAFSVVFEKNYILSLPYYEKQIEILKNTNLLFY